MNRKIIIIIAAGIVAVCVLVVAVAFLMPGFSRIIMGGEAVSPSSGPGFGPGMMNGNSAGQSSGDLVAVSPQGDPVALPAGSAVLPENTATQTVNGMNIMLALSPYPPQGHSQAAFEVTLTDENGKSVSDASVALDLTMPSMWMPANKVAAQYTENGLYQAVGRFTMRGLWRIEVIIQRGGEKTSAFFDVGL